MSGTAASGRGGQDDRYLLGDSTAEVEHLTHQAEVYAKEAGHADLHGDDVAGLGRQARGA